MSIMLLGFQRPRGNSQQWCGYKCNVHVIFTLGAGQAVSVPNHLGHCIGKNLLINTVTHRIWLWLSLNVTLFVVRM